MPQGPAAAQAPDFDRWPVLIRLLGRFGLLKNGVPMSVRSGGRTEALLSTLALRLRRGTTREAVTNEVWPDVDPVLAGQSLDTLIHNIRRMLSDALDGAPPITCTQGLYSLNVEAGVIVDIARFDHFADAGDREAGDELGDGIPSYLRAIALYAGDLCVDHNHQMIIERERLRARYLTMLARTAAYYYAHADLESCLQFALRLLEHDPCREDAHRLVMRCHVARAERAQALRQFRLCEQILRSEFDAVPEPETTALYDQIRADPTNT